MADTGGLSHARPGAVIKERRLQRGWTIGQRVWNSQPEGRLNTLGISPLMARLARRWRGSGTGSD